MYQGQAPYRIPNFISEVTRDLGKNLDSIKIKKILDQITTIYNEKVKEEKEKDKPNKKPQKSKLNAGKQAANNKLIENLMGDDDYGDEDEDDDEVVGKKGKGVRV